MTRWSNALASTRATLARTAARSTRPRSRGAAEVSVVILGASLVGGLLVGTGMTRTAVTALDGATWLADSPRGQVIQVSAATGTPDVALSVGEPGQEISVAQSDGRLIVANKATGTVTSVDLATLVASGKRNVSSGNDTKVLIHAGQAFLVDRKAGTISSVDPVSLATQGRVWTSPAAITDATVDGQGKVWAIDSAGRLTALGWSDESKLFTADVAKDIPGASSGGELVAHDSGVTVLAPSTGAIVQVGTGRDQVTAAPALQGEVAPAVDSPSDLVPASATQSGTVVLVRPDEVRQVDVRSLACAHPGRPTVFGGVVYVPCNGDNKIVRLDRFGARAGADIPTPKGQGDPQIVVNDGQLFVNVPGADQGLKVRPDGSTQTFTRFDPSIKPQQVKVGQAATPPSGNSQSKANEDRSHGQQSQGQEKKITPPTASTPPPTQAPVANSQAPTTAPPANTSQATVGSQPTSGAGGHAPGTPGPGGSGTGTAPPVGGTTTAPPTSVGPPVSIPPSGGPVTVPVTTNTAPPVTSAPPPPPPVTSAPPPPPPPTASAPTNVRAVANGDGSVTVSWGYAGSTPESFEVVENNTGTKVVVGGGARSAAFTGLAPGSAAAFTSTAVLNGSRSSGASNSVTVSQAMPAAGASIVTYRTNGPTVNPKGYPKVTTSVTLTLAPPPSWAGWTGTCSVVGSDITTKTVPCNSTSAIVTARNPGSDGENASYTVQLVAYSGGAEVSRSAVETFEIFWELDSQCQQQQPGQPQQVCQIK